MKKSIKTIKSLQQLQAFEIKKSDQKKLKGGTIIGEDIIEL